MGIFHELRLFLSDLLLRHSFAVATPKAIVIRRTSVPK